METVILSSKYQLVLPRGARPGCPRCGSTCALFDDCVVCSGMVVCARCLFGPRVEDDEIHATLVLSG